MATITRPLDLVTEIAARRYGQIFVEALASIHAEIIVHVVANSMKTALTRTLARNLQSEDDIRARILKLFQETFGHPAIEIGETDDGEQKIVFTFDDDDEAVWFVMAKL